MIRRRSRETPGTREMSAEPSQLEGVPTVTRYTCSSAARSRSVVKDSEPHLWAAASRAHGWERHHAEADRSWPRCCLRRLQCVRTPRGMPQPPVLRSRFRLHRSAWIADAPKNYQVPVSAHHRTSGAGSRSESTVMLLPAALELSHSGGDREAGQLPEGDGEQLCCHGALCGIARVNAPFAGGRDQSQH